MRQLFIYLALFLCVPSFAADIAIQISGLFPVKTNQMCTYVANYSGPDAGLKATWKVVNGKFRDADGNFSSTEIQVSTNTKSVDVKWNDGGDMDGTITYYYKNGSTIYSGMLSVSIVNNNGGGTPTTPNHNLLPPEIILNSENVICENGVASYSMDDRYGFDFSTYNLTVEWIAGANMTLVSGQGTKNAIFRGNGNGEGVVKARVRLIRTYSPGSTEEWMCENQEVWVGLPEIPYIIGFESDGMQFLPNTRYDFYAGTRSDADGISWTITGSQTAATLTGSDNPYHMGLQTNGTGNAATKALFGLRLTTVNICGSNTVERRSYYWGGSKLRSLMPTGTTDLSHSTKDVLNHVKVYSVSGVLIYSSKVVTQNFDINSLGLCKNTVYIVEKADIDGNIQRNKVLLK